MTDHLRTFRIASEHTLEQERSPRGQAELLVTLETARNPLSALIASVDPESDDTSRALGTGPHASRRIVSIEEVRRVAGLPFSLSDKDYEARLCELLAERLLPASDLWQGVRGWPWDDVKLRPVLAALADLLPGVSLARVDTDGSGAAKQVLFSAGRYAVLDQEECRQLCALSSSDDGRIVAVGLWLLFAGETLL